MEGVYYCILCESSYCEEHSLHSLKSTEGGHKAEKAEGKFKPVEYRERKCTQHLEDMHVWCIQCKSLICYICASFASHQGHNVTLLKEARESSQKELVEVLKQADCVYNKSMEEVDAFVEAISSVEKRYESSLQNIENQFQILMEKIIKKRDTITAELNDAKSLAITRMKKGHLESRMQAIQVFQSSEMGKRVLNWNNNMEFFEMLGVVLNSLKTKSSSPHNEIFGLNTRWGPSSPSTLLSSVANISITIDTPNLHQLQGIVDNFAGSGIYGRADGNGNQTKFSCPWGITIDANENIYVAEYGNHQIRKITKEGIVSTFAGSGKQGDADGAGIQASFSGPLGITVDAEDNLYVADLGNHKIRKITRQGVVSTIAGSFAGFSDGVGSHAKFSGPINIAVDLDENLYVADSNNHRIRKITSEGIVSTIAGNGTPGNTDGIGTQALFNNPRGIALDADGNIYVSDTGNSRIRRISPQGIVTTLAGDSCGNIDGIGANAQFAFLAGIAIDASGSLLVADQGNHTIRKVTLRGKVSTIAGSSAGYSNGQGSSSQFASPSGIAINSQGDVFVCEYHNHRIRKIV